MQVDRQLKILAVDEDIASLLVLNDVFRDRGHIYEGTTCARRALIRVSVLQPDVVLYEWDRCDGLGIGLAGRIRAAAHPRRPVVIALSALDEPAELRQTEEIAAYMIKPFRLELLDALLSKPHELLV